MTEALLAAAAWAGTASSPPLDYLALFVSAFLAATILPFYSELVLAGLVLAGRDPVLLWAFATAGNTLGALLNWWIGIGLEAWRERRGNPRWLDWLRLGDAEFERAQRWFGRWGYYSLLLAWAPVGGDALTFVAGVMKVRALPFLLLVGLGKGGRYLVVILLAEEGGRALG